MRTSHVGTGCRPVRIWAAVFAVASATPLVGQKRLDPWTAEYSGFIVWENWSTDTDGTATETVKAIVVAGVVQCDVAYVSPGHSANAKGAGLLEIQLVLPPDNAYTFKVACPDAEYSDGIREARWSRSMDSERQPGGGRVDTQTGKLILPGKLEGTWTQRFGGGSSTSKLTWHLCTDTECKTPPTPPTPP